MPVQTTATTAGGEATERNWEFLKAIKAGNMTHALSKLDEGAHINSRGDSGATALHYVAWAGVTEMAAELIAHNANINLANDTGETPLHIAARNGHAELVRLLLKHQADITAQTKEGNTPLLNSAVAPDAQCAKILLDEGADIHAVNKLGHGVLHRAAFSGRMDQVRLFLEHGADPAQTDLRGKTAQMSAVNMGHEKEFAATLAEHYRKISNDHANRVKNLRLKRSKTAHP